MKTAIVVGHTEDSPGACSPHNISCEWEFNFGIATELYLREIADIFLYDTYAHGYTSMIHRNAKKLNKEKYDLIIELHYNSATPSATGCEALYYHREDENFDEQKIGEYFVDNWSEITGLKNRGVKRLTKNDRGYVAVYAPIGNCLILEPFFGSNPDDVKVMIEHYWDYVNLIEDLAKGE